MAAAVADVVAAAPDAFAPVRVIEFSIELYVRAPDADFLAIDAREIGLATDSRAEAHVERVIPDVQLPDVRRVDGGHEIHGWNRPAVPIRNLVRHIDDVLVRADAVEWGNDVVRQLRRVHLEAESRMGGPAHRSLALRPSQRVQPERGPVFEGGATRVDLFVEPQQHEMTGLMRPEA